MTAGCCHFAAFLIAEEVYERSNSNKPRSGLVRDKTSPSKKGVEGVDLRRQAAEAFKNLPEQDMGDENSESTESMVVEGVVRLQERYPHFKEAFQHSLPQDVRVPQGEKEANGYQSLGEAKSEDGTEKKMLQ